MSNARFKIYPIVDYGVFKEERSTKIESHYYARTSLRVKDKDGKMYFQDIVKKSVLPYEKNFIYLIDLIVELHKEVYYLIYCGIVNKKLKYDERDVFYLDENQMPEEERLKNILTF